MMNRLVQVVWVSLALAAAASAQNPGGEFLVNTHTTSGQSGSRLAMEPDGDFVVVWHSYLQDGSHFGVFGQRFAAPGTALGGEFRISSYSTGFQGTPDVAVGSTGDFVVVWTSVQDGSDTSIHGQRFDAGGSPVGGEFMANTITSGYQYGASVGQAADGRFVVLWESEGLDGSSYGIAARRFDASGIAVGSEFVVNTYTTGIQFLGDVAVEANGNFVAVWQDQSLDRDGSGSAIFGQRYDSSGNRLGSEFQVNSYTTGNQRRPSVSVSPSGDFVIAWFSTSGDGSDGAVFARIFDASGSPVGSDFVVNTYTTGSQYGYPGQIAHDADGNFVVTWQGEGAGTTAGTFAQRFSASGARRGAEFRVNTHPPGYQGPTVASDAVGNFVVAWASPDGSNDGVFAKRFDVDLIFRDGFDPTPP